MRVVWVNSYSTLLIKLKKGEKIKMVKKTIKYEDFDGNVREEDFYFNLNEAELTELNFSVAGGLEEKIKTIFKAKDIKSLIEIFKTIIHVSYGQKSADGRKFVKSKEILDDFISTNAYPKLYMELATDDVKASDFINGIIPKNLASEVEKRKALENA